MMDLACNHFMVLGKYKCKLYILGKMLTLETCEDEPEEQKADSCLQSLSPCWG